MYKLNDKEITKEKVDELIDDLALFPYDAEDYNLSTSERKIKYEEEFKKQKSLIIAENLKITHS